MHSAIGLSPTLASEAFAGFLGMTEEEPKRNAASSDAVAGKKEVQKDSKSQVNDNRDPPPSSSSKDVFFEGLKSLQFAQNSQTTTAQLLWLSPGAVNEESLELLRRTLGASSYGAAGPYAADTSPFSRATVTSTTSRGHFSLAVAGMHHESTQQLTKSVTPTQDAPVLVAIFAGPEVISSSGFAI